MSSSAQKTEVPLNIEDEFIQSRKERGFFAEFWRMFRKNKLAVAGLIVIVLYIIMALFADFFYSEDFILSNQISNAFAPPGTRAEIDWDGAASEHRYILGADNFGRDVLGRIVHGARISMIIGFVTVIFSIIVGGGLGALAGYYGGTLETVIMRGADILLAIPNVLFAMAIVAALGPSFRNLLLAIGIAALPTYVRIVRASVLTVKDQEFVEAARAIGARDFRIILLHVLPNCMAPVIVQATLGIAQNILSATFLSFLGLGIQPPSPEWGNMLSEARQYIIIAPHTLIFPGLAIMMVILAYNLIGDGLRDALDPKLKR
ncbi:ABC transporter permease [Treponema sp. OttesenSCG-928-L16]|nr:ABC transporter permease [Treponema sp. OttesenSCG-928-L16]